MFVASWYVGCSYRVGDEHAVQHAGFATEAEATAHLGTLEGKQKVVWELDDVAPVWVQKETAA